MSLHIIHLNHREDRLLSLSKALAEQEICDYVIWQGRQDIEGNSEFVRVQSYFVYLNDTD